MSPAIISIKHQATVVTATIIVDRTPGGAPVKRWFTILEYRGRYYFATTNKVVAQDQRVWVTPVGYDEMRILYR